MRVRVMAGLTVLLVLAGVLVLAPHWGLLARLRQVPNPVTGQPTLPPSASPEPAIAAADPFSVISQDSLLGYIEALTAIQPNSGWRIPASQGEVQALDYVAQRLGEFEYLRNLGLELERQSFRVFLGAELGSSHLELTLGGREIEVPANAVWGFSTSITQALYFDSDGTLNDSTPDPVVVEGSPRVIRSADEVDALGTEDLRDQVILLDYAVIDQFASREARTPIAAADSLLLKAPAALVLITQFSNEPGQSHGSFVGTGGPLYRGRTQALPPVLYVRLEDLVPAGINGWEDLTRVTKARLTWDADVFSPASSGNLVARIPGHDPSRAVILGAHVDSANSPGAMDDASGAAILLEIARVLDVAQRQPPIDLWLVWFGSEESGLYGSAAFTASHQDLLDRTVGMLQVDCLSYPLDGIGASINLVTWPSDVGASASGHQTWTGYLVQAAERHGVEAIATEIARAYSDNSNFGWYNVPNADLIYMDEAAMEATGSLHYAAHMHDPYDTLALAREGGDVLEQMAQVALSAALEPPEDVGAFRTTPRSERRAVFVASHTEAASMMPAVLANLGAVLAASGYDVDLIPYGQPVTAADVQDADLVVALPVVDYPSPGVSPPPYDEGWDPTEVAVLTRYVEAGGLLVLTNSAHRLGYYATVLDSNEDWIDANVLATPLGITYYGGDPSGSQAQTQGRSPLTDGVASLEFVTGNGVPFSLAATADAQVLAAVDAVPVAALLDYGQGQVLALADLSILGGAEGSPFSFRFWSQLASYARLP